jgi:hypothetical protein
MLSNFVRFDDKFEIKTYLFKGFLNDNYIINKENTSDKCPVDAIMVSNRGALGKNCIKSSPFMMKILKIVDVDIEYLT